MLPVLSGLEIKFLNKIYKKYTEKKSTIIYHIQETPSELGEQFNVLGFFWGFFFYAHIERTDFITGVDDVLQMDITPRRGQAFLMLVKLPHILNQNEIVFNK